MKFDAQGRLISPSGTPAHDRDAASPSEYRIDATRTTKRKRRDRVPRLNKPRLAEWKRSCDTRVSGYKLKRDAGSRKALLKDLVTSVIEHERIVTTVTKAKAAQPLVDKMITLAKRDTLHARRQAARFWRRPPR